MSETIQCTRCGRTAQAAKTPPLLPPGQAEEIRRKVCSRCWTEWQRMEVMVINELRLNFMDPRSQEILTQQMREFLALDAPSPAAAPEAPASSE